MVIWVSDTSNMASAAVALAVLFTVRLEVVMGRNLTVNVIKALERSVFCAPPLGRLLEAETSKLVSLEPLKLELAVRLALLSGLEMNGAVEMVYSPAFRVLEGLV